MFCCFNSPIKWETWDNSITKYQITSITDSHNAKIFAHEKKEVLNNLWRKVRHETLGRDQSQMGTTWSFFF